MGHRNSVKQKRPPCRKVKVISDPGSFGNIRLKIQKVSTNDSFSHKKETVKGREKTGSVKVFSRTYCEQFNLRRLISLFKFGSNSFTVRTISY